MKLNFRRGGAFASQYAKKFAASKNPDDIKKITVIRHAAIGDFIVIRPFLIELKKFFPNAEVTLSVLRSSMYGMPEDLVDHIHIMDKVDPNNKAKKIGLIGRIKQAKSMPPQDIIFDLTDSALTLLMIIFSPSKLTVGYSYRAFRRLFYNISTLRSDFVFETQSILHQLNMFGANTQHYPLEYQLTTQTRNTDQPFIVYFPGASVKSKCWPEDKFVELIEKMCIDYPDYNHVILKGIQADEDFKAIYSPFLNQHNVIHQDPLPLDKIYDYLAQASLVIAGDTGVRHMAIGANTPTLGIMWIPHLTALRYLPKIQQHQVVFNPNYTPPLADDVYKATHKMLSNIYSTDT
ncbi:MAG: glycosyltransferase family 9 protein [Gammaproteobacteria bacterium]|nr:glycosyltransferase family 9 protein [Gammaproteobacteria bacterium]